uniref:ester cyclase n=1 Tax=Nonomuraea pusilla TaxID=46177 RepID=UPI00191BFD94|nr:ester cyclase [Nonomuraea pusilla]
MTGTTHMRIRTILGAASAALCAAALASAPASAATTAATTATVTATSGGPHGARASWPWNLVDRSPGLVRPKALTVDRSIGARRAAREVRLAQLLYTFWDTGDRKYLDAAVGPGFRDNTLPPGRPQGIEGPLFASKRFRAAVPDLTCELADVLVAGDRITARLVFRGHFTGTFAGVAGKGQAVEFNAIDIQHAGHDKIIEDWHIEDNQTLLTQLGVTAS